MLPLILKSPKNVGNFQFPFILGHLVVYVFYLGNMDLSRGQDMNSRGLGASIRRFSAVLKLYLKTRLMLNGSYRVISSMEDNML